MDIEDMREVDVRTVDLETLVDVSTIVIDESLSRIFTVTIAYLSGNALNSLPGHCFLKGFRPIAGFSYGAINSPKKLYMQA